MSYELLEKGNNDPRTLFEARQRERAAERRASRESRQHTPGRNDLCHCGSGRKFKRCHGSPAVAAEKRATAL